MNDETPSPPPGRRRKRASQIFWLSFLAVGLAYAGYCFYVPANDVAWAADVVEAREVAAETGQPMMLFFTSDWCVPCRVMKRQVFADDEVATALNAAVVPVMVKKGAPGAEAAFLQYEVQGTPITVFTDADGVVLDYAVGGIGKDEFLTLLGGIEGIGGAR